MFVLRRKKEVRMRWEAVGKDVPFSDIPSIVARKLPAAPTRKKRSHQLLFFPGLFLHFFLVHEEEWMGKGRTADDMIDPAESLDAQSNCFPEHLGIAHVGGETQRLLSCFLGEFSCRSFDDGLTSSDDDGVCSVFAHT